MWGAWAVLAVLLVAPLVSREIRFVYRGGYELARIHLRSRSLTVVLDDPATDAETRRALTLARDARAFAMASLGLDAGDSFTRFSDVGRDTLVLVLTASRPDTLVPYTWWFPITGRVPYHGYYSLAAAERAEARLAGRGLDTYLRPAPAFSTLGWLPDPVLSTAVTPGPWMAVTVMHELAHNTIWLAGDVTFSESLASLIGYRGAEAFFRNRGDSATADTVARAWAASRVLSRIQARLVADLQARRADAFARADSALGANALRGGHALRTAIDEHNYAAVIAAGLYHGDLDGLEALYQSCGADLRRLVASVRAGVRPPQPCPSQSPGRQSATAPPSP